MFILGPSDSPVNDSKSDMTHSHFGGQRKVTDGVQKAEDYTQRTTTAADVQENPVDDATKDVDDLNDLKARKNDTKRQVDSFLTGDKNKEHFNVSDLENKPLDEGREDSAFQTPDAEKPHGTLHPYNPYFVDTHNNEQ
jgi:hypothetical protein